MSDRLGRAAAGLALVALLTHPHPPEPAGARVAGAAAGVLEEAERAAASRQVRAYGEGYGHWARGAGADPLAAAGISAGQPRGPIMAGLVGLAAAIGLQEVAALFLYLRSDLAEHERDWAMFDLCLEVIPWIDPHFVDAYTIRAVYFMGSDPDRSRQILLEGVRANPGDWELWTDLAMLELRPPEGRAPDLAQVLRYLQGAVQGKHPHFVRRLFAAVLAGAGLRAEAERTYLDLLAEPGLAPADAALTEAALADLRAGRDKLKEYLARPSLDARRTAANRMLGKGLGHEHDPGPGDGHDHDHDHDHDGRPDH